MFRWSLALCLMGCGSKSDSEEPSPIDVGSGNDTGATDTDDPDDPDDPDTPDDTGEPSGPETIAVDEDPDCDPIAEGACMLPWPSDRYLRRKTSNETGYRLDYIQDVAWENIEGVKVDVEEFDRLDGFSPSSQILTLFDEPVDTDGTAFWDSIDLSLDEDHPTILLDLETGERLAHWVEVDARAERPDETVFFIRPTARLEPNRRYGVAIRGLDGISGEPIKPSEAFRAMRDDLELEPPMPKLESRRAGFESLFDALDEAGIERESLQQAWWFHTASDESTRGPFLAMRADAIERMGDQGLGCTVESAETTSVGGRLIKGTFTVPWYLDGPLAPSELVRDSDGNPVYQGTEEIVFSAYIPEILLNNIESRPLMLWGHGLFGSGPPLMEEDGVQLIAEEMAQPMAATDWHGMSSKDLVFLATALADVSKFYMVGDNLQQAMVIKNALTRSLIGTCADDLDFQRNDGGRAISASNPRFIGISQGSVLGGTFLTQSPDIERGALIVGGANFSFMIERSIHFNRYEAFLKPFYGDRLVTAQLMAFSQHVWDAAESAAYIGAAKEGLEGVGPKRFLYLVAQNDSQVPNLASDIAVRMTNMPVLEDSSYKPWGAEVIEGPTTESAFVSFHMGDRDTPRGNESPDDDDGGHNSAATTDAGVEMILNFFETGEIASTCDGLCIFY